MIRHEERAARLRNVFPAANAKPVNRVRDAPDDQSNQRIGKQIHGISGSQKRENRAIQKHLSRRLMQQPREAQIGDGREGDSDERHEVCRGNHAAFLFGTRPVLDQRVQRDGKHSSEESEQRKMCAGDPQRFYREIQEGAEDRHTDRADGNQAVFDFAAGKITRRDATKDRKSTRLNSSHPSTPTFPYTTLFRSRGRCWINAFSGTANIPPKNPSSARCVPATHRDFTGKYKKALKTVIPIAPMGIRPYSILPPER